MCDRNIDAVTTSALLDILVSICLSLALVSKSAGFPLRVHRLPGADEVSLRY